MSTFTTAMRIVPATPVCPQYEALHAFDGSSWHLLVEIAGRQCYVVTQVRTSNPWRGRRGAAFDVIIVRYIDDGSAGRFTATEFARKAKAPKGVAS